MLAFPGLSVYTVQNRVQFKMSLEPFWWLKVLLAKGSAVTGVLTLSPLNITHHHPNCLQRKELMVAGSLCLRMILKDPNLIPHGWVKL